MNASPEAALAAAIETTRQRFEGTPDFKRLRLRVRELGDDPHDEVAQLKLLQRACRLGGEARWGDSLVEMVGPPALAKRFPRSRSAMTMTMRRVRRYAPPMPRRRRASPPSPPARPAHGTLLTQRQLDRFVAYVRERGISQEACELDGLQGFVEALQARVGVAAVRAALAAAGIDACEFCAREGKVSVATENVEVDTGQRSVGAFVLTCDACRPKALAAGAAAST